MTPLGHLADHSLQDDLILLSLLGLLGQGLADLPNQARKSLKDNVLTDPSQDKIHDAQGEDEHLEVPADRSKIHQTHEPGSWAEDHVSSECNRGSDCSNEWPCE